MTAFARILVPVDFAPASDEAIAAGTAVPAGEQHVEISAATRRAVQVAAGLARQSGGKLHMVHATPPLQMGAVYTGPLTVPSQIVEEIHQRAKRASLDAMNALRGELCEGVDVELDARPGQPLTFVLAEAADTKADLIVLAASGRSRVARFFVGSTADRVIRQAPCPVLVIPASDED
jgi:nucleotide-binding universal stress UspA family protein